MSSRDKEPERGRIGSGRPATIQYPDGWFTVHFGLSGTKEYAESVTASIAKRCAETGMPFAWFVDGDNWQEWGEPVTAIGPDYHCQIATPILGAAVTLRSAIAMAYAETFSMVPIYSPGMKGWYFGVISLSEDWATGDDLEALLSRHDIMRDMQVPPVTAQPRT